MSDSILRPHSFRVAPRGPLLMVVMDGVGFGRGDASDAVASAHTPNLDWLMGLPSATRLRAHGKAVGMPSDKDMGNSEVGHNAIGAGRIFEQGAALVKAAIDSGRIFEGRVWNEALATVRASEEPLHFMGLLSDGNVHSHIDHLLAMIARARSEGIARVRVHVLLDGRDVDVRSALIYAAQLEACLADAKAAGLDYAVASGGGRMKITMDRYEADWAMVQRGWALHVHGEGRRFEGLEVAVQTMYDESTLGDQDLPGFVIAQDGEAVGPIRDGAAVIFFNFRGDRAMEITRAFETPAEADFPHFDRRRVPKVYYAGMMQYDGDAMLPTQYLVEPPAIDRTMGELLAAQGRTQLAIAETHKFGHVTYFWNGNRSEMFDPKLERYVEVASDLTPVEHHPWMKAGEVCDRLISELDAKPTDFARVNFANGDMVGHTGELTATRLAVEVVDLCLARLIEAVRVREGALLVTADHGNADHMFDGEGEARRVRTSHSLNPVPFALYDPRMPGGGPSLAPSAGEGAGLGNLAASVLEILGFSAPEGYLPSLLDPSAGS